MSIWLNESVWAHNLVSFNKKIYGVGVGLKSTFAMLTWLVTHIFELACALRLLISLAEIKSIRPVESTILRNSTNFPYYNSTSAATVIVIVCVPKNGSLDHKM